VISAWATLFSARMLAALITKSAWVTPALRKWSSGRCAPCALRPSFSGSRVPGSAAWPLAVDVRARSKTAGVQLLLI